MINGDDRFYGNADYEDNMGYEGDHHGPIHDNGRRKARCKFCGCTNLTWAEVGAGKKWMLYDQDAHGTIEECQHNCKDSKEKERLKRIDQMQEKIDELQIAQDTQIRAIEKLKSNTYSHDDWNRWLDKNSKVGKEKLYRRVTNSEGKVLIKVYQAFVNENKAYAVYPEVELSHGSIKSVSEQEENTEVPRGFRSIHKICTVEDKIVYGLRKHYDKD